MKVLMRDILLLNKNEAKVRLKTERVICWTRNITEVIALLINLLILNYADLTRIDGT